ncbi:hypothetical protein G3I44_10920 [Halogeometricum borinquense]|uniref:Uncharacterized protein n=1 Tax=Halogeometricum borinquense TaxID=60847 RepID=A0A6C0UGZ1_9EURY|nr:hypothetical protein [Halogeometricum borinquense]QIB74752.1 hypothetical protein G3I44_10920 [Halogeometricum borinquense]
MTENPDPVRANPEAEHFRGLLLAEGEEERADWFTDRYTHLRKRIGCSRPAAFIVASEELISAQTAARKEELGEAYAVIDTTRVDLDVIRRMIGAEEPDDIPTSGSVGGGPLHDHVIRGEQRTEWMASQEELNLEDWI